VFWLHYGGEYDPTFWQVICVGGGDPSEEDAQNEINAIQTIINQLEFL